VSGEWDRQGRRFLLIAPVTLLTRSRIYWYLGLVFSVFGIVSALSAYLVH